MSDKYILKGHDLVRCDLMTWARNFEGSDCAVAKTKIGKVVVSTVFLGIDHRFGEEGPPLVFETMIFGGKHDQFQNRYSTWEEAEHGHNSAVRMVVEK